MGSKTTKNSNPTSVPTTSGVVPSKKKRKTPKTSSELAKPHQKQVTKVNRASAMTKVKRDQVSPRLTKPFRSGWKRELVRRKKGNALDIYYFSPDGMKLRSIREVGQYLKQFKINDLTKDNFTFLKEPIYRAPFETKRDASEKPGDKSIRGKAKRSTNIQKPVKPKTSSMPASKPVLAAAAEGKASCSQVKPSQKPTKPGCKRVPSSEKQGSAVPIVKKRKVSSEPEQTVILEKVDSSESLWKKCIIM